MVKLSTSIRTIRGTEHFWLLGYVGPGSVKKYTDQSAISKLAMFTIMRNAPSGATFAILLEGFEGKTVYLAPDMNKPFWPINEDGNQFVEFRTVYEFVDIDQAIMTCAMLAGK